MANCNADGSGSSWNNAYAQALDDVYERSRKIFSGKEDRPVKLDGRKQEKPPIYSSSLRSNRHLSHNLSLQLSYRKETVKNG